MGLASLVKELAQQVSIGVEGELGVVKHGLTHRLLSYGDAPHPKRLKAGFRPRPHDDDEAAPQSGADKRRRQGSSQSAKDIHHRGNQGRRNGRGRQLRALEEHCQSSLHGDGLNLNELYYKNTNE
jgi:hypothetical protein